MISVVICTYNSGEITRRAIESVLNCNYENIECLVIDGASKDGTVNIIKSYVDNPKFRYISESDTGIYNAMNKGWRMAKGEWIHYLGADDELLPNGLHELLDNVDETLGRAGFEAKQIEGTRNSSWVLMDYGDMIVHVFDEENRLFYDLERIWRDGKVLDVNEFLEK